MGYPGDRVPTTDEVVWIPRDCTYIMDVPLTDIYDKVVVDGRVIWEWDSTLQSNFDFKLRTHVFYNRGGKVQIGGELDSTTLEFTKV